MKTLFNLSPEELRKVSIEAEFDEKYQLVLNEENCIHQDGIVIFKQPIHILYEDFMCEITDVKVIIKEERATNKVYMFAMTETKSEEALEVLYHYFESGNGPENGCYGVNTHKKGWKFGNRIWEV